MPDPSNPNGNWQDVPNAIPTQPSGSVPPGGGYPSQPPPPGYPPQAQGGYPPPNYPPQPPPGYAQPGYPPQNPYGQPGYPQQQASTGMKPTTAAAVSYITFIPAVIFLFTEPYKSTPFVRFHSVQCLGLTALSIAINIVEKLLYAMLPYSLYLVLSLVFGLVGLALFVVWVICIVKANKGEWFKLPVIGDIAMGQAQKS